MLKLGKQIVSAPASVAITGVLVASAFGLAGCGSSSSNSSTKTSSTSGSSSKTAAMPGLKTPGTLVVGMTLQFKPEMYLNAHGQPAGYDVDLLHMLAAYAHVKLKIDNLAFTGLIPGLQTHKFDMVSAGLAPTPARSKVVSFTKPYLPFPLIVAVPTADADSVTSIAALNKPSVKISALLGSSDQVEAKKVFPNAKIEALADENSDFGLVATGRANAIVVEENLLAEYNLVNPGKLTEAKLKPLVVQYGSYAVQRGNTALVNYLNTFICKNQQNGTLTSLYKKVFGVTTVPPMPACT
jgi:ABC-type amino acid transport substrate-binding protein